MSIKRIALIIVDPQLDFGSSSGALYVPGGEKVISEINALRHALNANDVFITQDFHPKDHVSFVTNNPGTTVFSEVVLADGTNQVMWPPHCVQGSEGANFLDGLVIESSDIIVQKGTVVDVDSYSGFASNDGFKERTKLESELRARGVTHLVVCGLAYDYCVSFTALDGAKCGFEVCVVRSATKGISKESCLAQDKLMREAKIVLAENIAEALAFSD